ncbi:hypothetical protein CRE_08761 [Caenorhabditis remanei]|uniref:Uncharacterized protein n=1 Tax=Caenorhabditis remanei TaxID=31234 RepID=E3LHD3_CAERE|nr:hypothetical protein CRE_08761 [Caenorhabditis remanei]
MPAPLYLTGPCEICDQPAHGRHFGVLSCRACAAFFRRMATKNDKTSQKNRKRSLLENEKSTNMNIEARCFIGNCVIYKNGKFNCKRCRLKKCYDMGMDANKFQTNRDPLSSTNTFFERLLFTGPQSMSNFLGRPEFILCCEPDKASHIKTVIDVSHLLEKAKRIFKEEDSFSKVMPYNFENSLEKLSYSMDLMRSKNPKIPLEKLRVIGKTEALFFWEQEFLGAAYWFAGIPEFMELDLSIKIEIVKAAWILWIRLEKLAETAYYHKKQELDGDLIICGQHTCMDMKDFDIDIKWCTNYTMEQMRFYIMPETDKDWKECVCELINLNPTNVELNFMLLQLSLHAAGKRHQGKVLEATERLLQIQADHLHKYYIETLKMPHYAKRLTELLKVNKSIELDGRRRKERVQIAQLFDVFIIDFSHPEMFEFT